MLSQDVTWRIATANIILTVRLLVSGSGSWTSELLGLIPSGISDQQGTVELDEDVLDLLLALLVDVLLVVGDQRLGESLPDGVDLGDVATTLHTDADIDISKPVLSKKKNWLHELELKSSGLNQLQRASVNLDEALSPLAVGHGSGGLLATEGLDRLYGLLLVSHGSFSCRSESSNIS